MQENFGCCCSCCCCCTHLAVACQQRRGMAHRSHSAGVKKQQQNSPAFKDARLLLLASRLLRTGCACQITDLELQQDGGLVCVRVVADYRSCTADVICKHGFLLQSYSICGGDPETALCPSWKWFNNKTNGQSIHAYIQTYIFVYVRVVKGSVR